MYKKEFFDHIQEIDNHNEVKKMHGFKQHGMTSTYAHAKQVAYFSYVLAKKFKLKVDFSSLTRGAFLHDFYLYDHHHLKGGRLMHGFKHPKIAANNAKTKFDLNDKEINIIESHMWPRAVHRIPKSKEAVIVCLVDKYCAIMEYIKFSKGFVYDN